MNEPWFQWTAFALAFLFFLWALGAFKQMPRYQKPRDRLN
jgi:hypothetical protein